MGCNNSSTFSDLLKGDHISPEKKRSEEIDEMLWYSNEERNNFIGVLLMGGSGSGKSTIMKHLRYTDDDAENVDMLQEATKLYARWTFYRSVRTLIRMSKWLNNSIVALKRSKGGKTIEREFLVKACHQKALDEFVQRVEQQGFLSEFQLSDTDDLLRFWRDPGVQSIYSLRQFYDISDSIEYFFKRLPDILQPDYKPTYEDIIRTHIDYGRDVGVYDLSIQGDHFQIYDVGGCRGDPKKWWSLFDNCSLVMYVISLAEYDEFMKDGTNKLLYAFHKCNEAFLSRSFRDVPFVVVLNKKDIFQQKLRRTPLSVCFPDYKGSDEFLEAIEYVKSLFPSTMMNVHVLCATDPNLYQIIKEMVEDMFLQIHLYDVMGVEEKEWQKDRVEGIAQAQNFSKAAYDVHIPVSASILQQIEMDDLVHVPISNHSTASMMDMKFNVEDPNFAYHYYSDPPYIKPLDKESEESYRSMGYSTYAATTQKSTTHEQSASQHAPAFTVLESKEFKHLPILSVAKRPDCSPIILIKNERLLTAVWNRFFVKAGDIGGDVYATQLAHRDPELHENFRELMPHSRVDTLVMFPGREDFVQIYGSVMLVSDYVPTITETGYTNPIDLLIPAAEQVDLLNRLGYLHCDLAPRNVRPPAFLSTFFLIDCGLLQQPGVPVNTRYPTYVSPPWFWKTRNITDTHDRYMFMVLMCTFCGVNITQSFSTMDGPLNKFQPLSTDDVIWKHTLSQVITEGFYRTVQSQFYEEFQSLVDHLSGLISCSKTTPPNTVTGSVSISMKNCNCKECEPLEASRQYVIHVVAPQLRSDDEKDWVEREYQKYVALGMVCHHRWTTASASNMERVRSVFNECMVQLPSLSCRQMVSKFRPFLLPHAIALAQDFDFYPAATALHGLNYENDTDQLFTNAVYAEH